MSSTSFEIVYVPIIISDVSKKERMQCLLLMVEDFKDIMSYIDHQTCNQDYHAIYL